MQDKWLICAVAVAGSASQLNSDKPVPHYRACGIAHSRRIFGRKWNADRLVFRVATVRHSIEGDTILVYLRKTITHPTRKRNTQIVQCKDASPEIRYDEGERLGIDLLLTVPVVVISHSGFS